MYNVWDNISQGRNKKKKIRIRISKQKKYFEDESEVLLAFRKKCRLSLLENKNNLFVD